MRQIRATLRALLYHFVVLLKLPISWQASLLPKRFFSTQIFTVSLHRVRLYSSSDPSPPKHSSFFCFKSSEEKEMHPLTSIFSEMTDESPRTCVHNTLRDLFINGKKFRATSQYERMIKSVSEGINLYKCQSIEEIDLYFERLIQTYHSIKSDGYKTQQELGASPRDEIRIHVLENGSLCLGSKGNHRFRMAELLNIKHIPCIIYGVSLNWIISLSKQTNLPPHQALLNWMKNQKHQVSEDSDTDTGQSI